MTFQEKRKYVNSLDIQALNEAVKFMDANFDETESSKGYWWPLRIEVWGEQTASTAGWIHWHGDGFWAIEPVMYDFPGEDDE